MAEMNRSFFKKSDLILLALAALLCVGALFYFYQRRQNQEGYNYAVVSIDGKEVLSFNLRDYTESTTVNLMEEYGVPATLELKDHQIRFINVTCPDHICENYGFIQNELESAICLPNKTAVIIYTPEEMKNRR